MSTLAESLLAASAALKTRLSSDGEFCAAIQKIAEALLKCTSAGGTIYSCGNGGSACDAMHLTEELVARYKRERVGIRAMHLGDAATLSCWSNDYAYDGVFQRQVETFCGANDVLIGISTSGNSKNVINAVTAAKNKGTATVGFLGKNGGALKAMVDHALVVPSEETERIQEVHITVIHILCEIMERKILGID